MHIRLFNYYMAIIHGKSKVSRVRGKLKIWRLQVRLSAPATNKMYSTPVGLGQFSSILILLGW